MTWNALGRDTRDACLQRLGPNGFHISVLPISLQPPKLASRRAGSVIRCIPNANDLDSIETHPVRRVVSTLRPFHYPL
jgi:hypothetical protein